MVTYAELDKACGEVDGIPEKEISVDTVQCAINLRAGVSTSDMQIVEWCALKM